MQQNKAEDKEVVLKQAFEYISDAGKMITDLQCEVSKTRRAFITSGLKPLVMNIALESPIDTTLYGKNFSERYKTAMEVEKVG